MFELSLQQAQQAIINGGSKSTVLLQGHMGTGKSSLLNALAEELPDHVPCYFDCTTKDLGDIAIPNVSDLDGAQYVEFVINEELGMHHGRPVILNIDELGKANRAVQNALLRVMLERKIGTCELHPDSIVFATTNLGAERVGDMLQPHARNRITVVKTKKPDALEWIEWGIANDIDPLVLGWVKDNPQVMQSFEDVQNPDDNPYIFHPQAQRDAFVTPRSLERASHWLKLRTELDDSTLTATLIGSIGQRAGLDLMAFIKLADQLPKLQDIKDTPLTAKIPESASAVCLVVFRSLLNIDKSWVDNWLTYMERLDTEAQAMFVNGVRADKYPHKTILMTNKKFQQWALKNNYLFASDI